MPASSKEFLKFQATTEGRFALERVCDMIKTHIRNVLSSSPVSLLIKYWLRCSLDTNSQYFRPILESMLCWGVPKLFHIARLRSTYKTTFRCASTSCGESLSKACCMPQHGFSTASKMKRCSVDVIFLYKLERLEKYFPVNWRIIIEYIHKHYIK